MKLIIIKIFFILSFFIVNSLCASSGKVLAKEFGLIAGVKAIVQWERIFKSSSKMARYKLDSLTPLQRKKLLTYLVLHAIDSDQPTVAGEY